MDRWLRKIVGLPLAAAALGALGQTPAPKAATAGSGLEFDQLSLSLPAAQPVPPPEAFEQQYAAAVRALRETPSPTSPEQLQALTAGLPAPSTSASLAHQRARMYAAGAGEMVQGLVLRDVPLLGAAAEMVEQGVGRHVEKRRMAAMQARIARQNAWMQALLARPQLVHVAVWGDRVRVDNLDGGQVLLVLPEQGQRVLLDPASRTYHLLPASPAMPALPGLADACDAAARDVSTLDSRDIADLRASGYRFAEAAPLSGRITRYTRYVSDLAVPEQVAQATSPEPSCPLDSPAAASAPGHGRLVLYQTAIPAADGGDVPPEQAAFASMLDRSRVVWRGHLHRLAQGDRDRFAIPSGYRLADSP